MEVEQRPERRWPCRKASEVVRTVDAANNADEVSRAQVSQLRKIAAAAVEAVGGGGTGAASSSGRGEQAGASSASANFSRWPRWLSTTPQRVPRVPRVPKAKAIKRCSRAQKALRRRAKRRRLEPWTPLWRWTLKVASDIHGAGGEAGGAAEEPGVGSNEMVEQATEGDKEEETTLPPRLRRECGTLWGLEAERDFARLGARVTLSLTIPVVTGVAASAELATVVDQTPERVAAPETATEDVEEIPDRDDPEEVLSQETEPVSVTSRGSS
eukprot:s345_g28.t1